MKVSKKQQTYGNTAQRYKFLLAMRTTLFRDQLTAIFDRKNSK